MISKFRNATKTSLLALTIAAVAGAASAPVYAQNSEIVVTARKASENIQDAPITLTAFSGEIFAKEGLAEFAQIANLTPNFKVQRLVSSVVL
tara:strand:+ start:482 stop:757 length:276 start_codon:yes stop_codon:yes gene_type:complete